MLWPDGPGHFRAGSGRAGRAGLPMPSYKREQLFLGCMGESVMLIRHGARTHYSTPAAQVGDKTGAVLKIQ
jgi:hypothetical protein